MTSSIKSHSASTYTVLSPGKGVHKVTLIPSDRFEQVEFYLIGKDQHEEIQLNVGQYILKLQEIGGDELQHIFRVNLTTDNVTINLTQLLESKRSPQIVLESMVKEQKTRTSKYLRNFPKVSSVPQLGRVRGRAKSRTQHKKENTSVDFGMPHPVLVYEGIKAVKVDAPYLPNDIPSAEYSIKEGQVDDEQRRSGIAEVSVTETSTSSVLGVPFSIGVSIRDEDSRWKPAKLKFETETNDKGEIRIWFHNLTRFVKDRIRVTVSVDGMPAIRVSIPAFSDGLNMTISTALTLDKADLGLKIQANDPILDGILSLIATGDEASMPPVMEYMKGTKSGAGSFFVGKITDPWAATLAAILLIKTRNAKIYTNQILKLARDFTNIPDANIISAWVTAVYPQGKVEASENKTLQHIISARKVGAPYFAASNVIAKELLKSLQYTAQNLTTRRLAVEELGYWNHRSRRRMFKSPIFIWEEKDKRLRSGKLWPEYYQVIMSGTLDRELWDSQSMALGFTQEHEN